ncbi:unnamed protein product [Withania somnifera]
MARPTGSAIASSSSVPTLGGGRQVPTSRGRGAKGAASSSGIQNRTYALASRRDLETSRDVVTVMICSRYTLADLIELEMVEFDVIMGMDWLASCYATMDCRTKRVCFHFPNEVILEWEGNVGAPREGIVVHNVAESSLVDEVKEKRYQDPILHRCKEKVNQGRTEAFELTQDGVLRCQNRLCDPSRITPIEDVQVTEDLTYEEVPIAILDRQVKKLRNKEMASVKVLWRNPQVEEVTWEAKETMKSKYPHLFEFEERVPQC